MRLVLTDLDGTLLDLPSSERRFIRHLARAGILGARQWLSAGLFFLRWTPRFGRVVGRKNKAYLSTLDVSRIERIAQDFAAAELLPRLRPAILERLRMHAAAGDVLVLLTGAPDFLAAPLARHIGARCCAAGLISQEGRYTPQPPRRHPLGAGKVVLAGMLARAARIDLSRCVAYADSGDDVLLLRAVGRAVAVSPDRRLEREAVRCGWEILRPEPQTGWGERRLETDV